MPHLARVGDQLASYMEEKEGEQLDAREVFGMYTMDALASAGYGLEINSFQEPENMFR